MLIQFSIIFYNSIIYDYYSNLYIYIIFIYIYIYLFIYIYIYMFKFLNKNLVAKFFSTKLPHKNVNKRKRIDEMLSNDKKETELWNAKDFINELKNKFPLNLNKSSSIPVKFDENLTCFLPLGSLINKTKAVAISKSFIEGLLNYTNGLDSQLDQWCEDNFLIKIVYEMENILKITKDKNSPLKAKLSIKGCKENSLRKANFNVNLYNIKNYILIGLEKNRKNKPNMKMVEYNSDMQIKNTISNVEELIKTDVVTFKNPSLMMTAAYDKIPIQLISQFEFTLISDKELKLVVEINDELNDKISKEEFNISSIDLKAECEVIRMTYNDILKIDKEMKKQDKQKTTELDDSFTFDEILKTLVKSENKASNLLLVDVDNIMKGNNFI
jgi:hypothetical protein